MNYTVKAELIFPTIDFILILFHKMHETVYYMSNCVTYNHTLLRIKSANTHRKGGGGVKCVFLNVHITKALSCNRDCSPMESNREKCFDMVESFVYGGFTAHLVHCVCVSIQRQISNEIGFCVCTRGIEKKTNEILLFTFGEHRLQRTRFGCCCFICG